MEVDAKVVIDPAIPDDLRNALTGNLANWETLLWTAKPDANKGKSQKDPSGMGCIGYSFFWFGVVTCAILAAVLWYSKAGGSAYFSLLGPGTIVLIGLIMLGAGASVRQDVTDTAYGITDWNILRAFRDKGQVRLQKVPLVSGISVSRVDGANGWGALYTTVQDDEGDWVQLINLVEIPHVAVVEELLKERIALAPAKSDPPSA